MEISYKVDQNNCEIIVGDVKYKFEHSQHSIMFYIDTMDKSNSAYLLRLISYIFDKFECYMAMSEINRKTNKFYITLCFEDEIKNIFDDIDKFSLTIENDLYFDDEYDKLSEMCISFKNKHGSITLEKKEPLMHISYDIDETIYEIYNICFTIKDGYMKIEFPVDVENESYFYSYVEYISDFTNSLSDDYSITNDLVRREKYLYIISTKNEFPDARSDFMDYIEHSPFYLLKCEK